MTRCVTFVSSAPATETSAGVIERRATCRRADGAVATIRRVLNGEEHNRLHVLLTNRSEGGVCLRCPIGLVRGGIYRLQLGSDPCESSLISILSSRMREVLTARGRAVVEEFCAAAAREKIPAQPLLDMGVVANQISEDNVFIVGFSWWQVVEPEMLEWSEADAGCVGHAGE